MELYQGKPSDLSARQEREQRVYELLERLAIPYTRTDHAPAQTMEDCVEIDKILGVAMCKNLFLCNRRKTDFYLLMMPAEKPFRTKELSAQLGTARLSFADEAAMLELLDIHPGAVSVMGLMNDRDGRVRLLIDEELLGCASVGCHPCVNTASLRLTTDDLLNRFLPEVGHAYRPVRLIGADPVT